MMTIMVVGANAQKRRSARSHSYGTSHGLVNPSGTNYLGVNASYATDFDGVGLGLKVNHQFPRNFRLEFSGDYFFKHDNVSFWDLNANLHYLFPIGSNFTLYPLGGLTFTSYHFSTPAYPGVPSVSDTSNHLGVNIGGGVQYNITQDWAINAEMKYLGISDYDQGIFTIGIAHTF